MQVYTMDQYYRRAVVLDELHACLWVEQYNDLGRFEVVVPSNEYYYNLLTPGTFVGNTKSLDVGTIETRTVEDGKITVSGPFQLGLFKYRVYRYNNNHEAQSGEFSGTAGELIEHQITWSCISPIAGVLPHSTENIITGLTLNSVDTSGATGDFAVRYGSLWEAIKPIAQEQEAGLRLRPVNTGPTSFSLLFDLYYGINRTREQLTYTPVIFDSALDSLDNAVEFDSTEKFYNVCYAYAPGITYEQLGNNYSVGTAVASGASALRNWDRRVAMLICSDISIDSVPSGGGYISPTTLNNMLTKRAQDFLANNNYVRMADGELVPQIGFEYNVDYFVGDIVELRAGHGNVSKARITEYIRSIDQTGYKEYPTLSIVD